MKRSSSKKPIERRKTPRTKAKRTEQKVSQAPQAEEPCQHCSKDLKNEERALFVEEEIGRVFCSEDCIAAYFAPEIERLEKEYFRNLSTSDLPPSEREKLAHLRWITLQEPDQVWREKTLTGDHRYTLISEFQPGEKPVWCVCICLFLRGEPSFLYLAFPTRNAAMVDHYRRGERIQWTRKSPPRSAESAPEVEGPVLLDGLADAWTEDETLRASLTQGRRADDIPLDEYHLYQACVEETLEAPDEVWSLETGTGDDGVKLYHFLRRYGDEKPEFWFVIVARDTDVEEQIEILDTFPTRDPQLVERYRQGQQEIGQEEAISTSRLVH